MAEIKRIIIHCSDSRDDLDIGVKEIRAWHTTPAPGGRGWKDIGYHYVVRRDGTVETGRYENGDSVLEGKEIGAHVAGQNSDSLAVCWVGRDALSPVQGRALLDHVYHLMTSHNVPLAGVLGHCELDPGKTCPNLNMADIRTLLESLDQLTG